MQLRRFNDIIAIKTPQEIVGFHARNLELAEVSIEAWNEMTPYEFMSSSIPVTDAPQNPNEALLEIQEWNKSENDQVTTSSVPNYVNHITINVTQVCNLHCTYCAAAGDGTYGDPVKKISIEKTLPQLKYLISKVPSGGNFKINFLGGEPLLYPEAIESIADYAKKETQDKNISLTFSIVTNGTLLSNKNIALLSKLKAHVTISFDGTPTQHDQVRKTISGKGSSPQILEGLQNLISEKVGSIGLSAVVGSEDTNLMNAYEFFSNLKIDWFEFNFEYSEKNMEIQKKYLDQLSQILLKAFEKGGEKELRRFRFINHYFDQLDQQKRIENHCGAGKSYLMIDARNKIYSCHWDVNSPNEEVGSHTEIDFKKIDQYKKNLIEKHNCQTCWARFMCGGGCMYINKSNMGDKSTKDPLFCERIRYIIAMALFYYYKSKAVA